MRTLGILALVLLVGLGLAAPPPASADILIKQADVAIDVVRTVVTASPYYIMGAGVVDWPGPVPGLVLGVAYTVPTGPTHVRGPELLITATSGRPGASGAFESYLASGPGPGPALGMVYSTNAVAVPPIRAVTMFLATGGRPGSDTLLSRGPADLAVGPVDTGLQHPIRA